MRRVWRVVGVLREWAILTVVAIGVIYLIEFAVWVAEEIAR